MNSNTSPGDAVGPALGEVGVRTLKVLVVAMGVLLVLGTVTLVALIVQRAGGGAGGSRPFDLALGQAEGTRIAGIAAVEGGGLAVWVQRPDGAERVLILDVRRGRVAGEIRPDAAAP
jgi:hypothetical protein